MLQHLCSNQRHKASDLSVVCVVGVARHGRCCSRLSLLCLDTPPPFMDKRVCFLHNVTTIWACRVLRFPWNFCEVLMISQYNIWGCCVSEWFLLAMAHIFPTVSCSLTATRDTSVCLPCLLHRPPSSNHNFCDPSTSTKDINSDAGFFSLPMTNIFPKPFKQISCSPTAATRVTSISLISTHTFFFFQKS